MITVKVTYTVKAEFVAQNKANISRFLDDFKKLDTATFRYSIFLQKDGITFVHISSYKNEEVQKRILETPSFKAFQKERDESGLGNTHQLEVLEFVGASSELLP